MIYAIVVLSISTLLLLLVVAALAAKCVDLTASFNVVSGQLQEKEEMFARSQKLVADKFDFFMPASKLYLEIAERELRKEQSNE
ncbi:hypothetical protein A5gp_00045 [Alteromonas phage vB_AemP_PT15-A5]|nr:hypothetical protein A5gp_00045 [Alteromonas phage vB_AemP_PT15-A5]